MSLLAGSVVSFCYIGVVSILPKQTGGSNWELTLWGCQQNLKEKLHSSDTTEAREPKLDTSLGTTRDPLLSLSAKAFSRKVSRPGLLTSEWAGYTLHSEA